MKKKRHCQQLAEREQRRREVEASLAKLQHAGLLGESRLIDGELHYYVGPQQFALMLELLKHPEKWPDHWSDETRAKLYAQRDIAIAKGLIQP